MIESIIKNNNAAKSIFVIGILFIIPFLFTDKTADPVLSIRFFGISIILLILSIFLCIYFQKNYGDYFISQKSILYPLILYFLFAILSLVNCNNLFYGVDEIFKIVIFITVILFTAFIFNNQQAIYIFIRAAIISSVLFSSVGIMQYYFNAINIPGGWGWPYGTMSNGNLYSSALFLFLPFILSGACLFERKWFIVSKIAFFITLLNIILTQTRAVWLALILSSLFVIITISIIHGKNIINKIHELHLVRKIIFTSIVFLLTILVGTITISIYNSSETGNQTLFSIANFSDTSVIERFIQWKKSFQMFLDYPIFGVGLGHWKIFFPSYGLGGLISEYGSRIFQRPHNDYIWILTETGIFGFLSYLMIFICSLHNAIKTIIKPIKRELKIINVFLIFGLIGYMVIAFFSFPKERIFHTVFLAVIIGLIFSISQTRYKKIKNMAKNKVNKRIGTLFTSSVGALMLFSTVYGYKYYINDQHVLKLLAYHRNGSWVRLMVESDKIDKRYFPLDDTSTPIDWYRGVANYSLKKMDKAFANFVSAFEHNPNHVHVLNNLATLYQLNGINDKAIELFNRAISIAPKFIDPVINLSAIYYNKGDYENSLKTIRQIDYDKNDPRLIFYLNRIDSMMSKHDKKY